MLQACYARKHVFLPKKKCPLFLPDLTITVISRLTYVNFPNILQILKKIGPAVFELLHEDGRTDTAK
jgi:hypothetical protein